MLLVETGFGTAGRLVGPAAAGALVLRGAVRTGLALAVLSAILLERTEAARATRLAEVRAWTSQQPGRLELVGRAEARGRDGLGRPRVLFRVEAAAAPGVPLVPRTGFVRLLLPRARTRPGDVRRMAPASVDLPPLGERVRVRGRFRGHPASANPGALRWELLPGGPRVRGSLTLGGWSPAGGRGADPLQRVRHALSGRLDGLFPPLAGGFMRAALFGDRESLHPRLREVFSRTGTGHIVAISGMNVAILAAIGWATLSPLLPAPRVRRRVLAVVLLLYVPLAGNSPSVARAACMASAVLLGQSAERRVLLPNALGLAALVLLAFQPESLLDPSFQLSVVAVAGLLLLPALPGGRLGGAFGALLVGARESEVVPRAPAARPSAASRTSLPSLVGSLVAGAVDLTLVTLASLLATLPLTLAYFRHLPLLAVPANLLVVPSLGVLTAGGLTAIAASFVSRPLALAYAHGCDLLLLGVFRALEVCAAPAWAWLPVAGPRLLLGAVGLCVSCLGFVALRARVWRRVAAAAAVVVAGAGALAVYVPSPASRELEVAVLSVGQGDAIVVLAPSGEALLVDGGPHGAGEAIVSFLHERGVLRLSRVLATHPDADHVSGLAEVLAQIAADSLHDPGQWGGGSPYRRMLEASVRSGAGYRALAAGERLRVGEVTLDVLWPPAGYAGRDPYWEGFATNDASLVVLLGYRGLRVLLTGDVGADVERELVRLYGDSLHSEVLKVAHHGSRSSSAAELLERTDPAVALISVGEGNGFGHPHPEVLARLRATSAIRRTDTEGALLLRSDGFRYSIEGYRSGDVEAGPRHGAPPRRPP